MIRAFGILVCIILFVNCLPDATLVAPKKWPENPGELFKMMKYRLPLNRIVKRLAHANPVITRPYVLLIATFYNLDFYINQTLYVHFCSGTLISSDIALTTPGCLQKKYPYPRNHGHVAAMLHYEFPIPESSTYPLYATYIKKRMNLHKTDEMNRKAVDLTILQLDNPAPIYCNSTFEYIKSARLPVKNFTQKVWEPIDATKFADCNFLGYGSNHIGEPNMVLRSLNGKWIERSFQSFSPLIAPEHYGRGCEGDEGGPVVCFPTNVPIVVGIYSGSSGPYVSNLVNLQCYSEPTRLYDRFTNIRPTIPFIQKSLRKMGVLEDFVNDNLKCEEFEATLDKAKGKYKMRK